MITLEMAIKHLKHRLSQDNTDNMKEYLTQLHDWLVELQSRRVAEAAAGLQKHIGQGTHGDL